MIGVILGIGVGIGFALFAIFYGVYHLHPKKKDVKGCKQ